MPAYSTTFLPKAIYPGDSETVWAAETVLTGAASQRVALGDPYNDGVGRLSVEIEFSADPGAFQIDVQNSDTDVDSSYQVVPSSSLTAVNASFKGRIDLYPLQGKFGRLVMTNDPANAVTVTARMIR